jgi:hypothetical protein
MPNILDQIVSPRRKRLQPLSVEEYVALQIARKLGDENGAAAYLSVSGRFPVSSLVHAYQHTVNLTSGESAWPVFKEHLPKRDVPALPDLGRIVALRVTGRSIALAVFSSLRLEFVRVRELALDRNDAENSAVEFVASALVRFPECAVVMEAGAPQRATRGSILEEAVAQLVRREGMPLFQVDGAELRSAYALPASGDRAQVRRIASSLWFGPVIRSANPIIYDSAALGLYHQAETLLRMEDGQEGRA